MSALNVQIVGPYGTANGIAWMSSAASTTRIYENVSNQLGVVVTPLCSKTAERLGAGGRQNYKGWVKGLEVKTGTVSMELDVLVYPAWKDEPPVAEVMIGMDWLRTMDPQVSWRKNTLTFKDGSVWPMVDLPHQSTLLFVPTASASPPDDVRVCGNCGKRLPGLKKCGLCKKEWYCDKQCQTEHWRAHKLTCTGRASKATPSPAVAAPSSG